MTTSPKTERPGCLAAVLRLFPWLAPTAARPEPLPYGLREALLTPAEHSFYQVLKGMLGEHFALCPKVSLNDIFFVQRPDRNIAYRNKIDRKHVDFLVCQPKTMQPVLGIELDDRSHRRPDRQERDDFVNRVFQTAGLPLLRVPAAASYSTRELAVLLRPHLAPKTEPAAQPEATGGTTAPPTCPKCGSEMILRQAAHGQHAGESFYGCTRYPDCRGVLPAESNA